MLPWTLGALLLSDAFATELNVTAANGQKAVVLVDDLVKGETPVITDVDPGEVTLAFRNSMFGPMLFSQKVTIPASGSLSYVVDLEQRTITASGTTAPQPAPVPVPAPNPVPVPAPAPAGKAVVDVRSATPGASITLDGQATGKVTPASLTVDPGLHVLELANGCQTGKLEFSSAAGAKDTLDVTLTGAKVMLSIQTEPAGATVFIDGKEFGTAPVDAKVTCGTREVKATLEGWRAAEQAVELGTDDSTVRLELEKDAFGKLEVSVEPTDAVIKLDGERVGTGKVVLDKVRVGEHELTVERKGVEVQKRTVKISEGGEVILALVVDDSAGSKPPKDPKEPKDSKPEGDGPGAARIVVNSVVTAGSVPLLVLGTYNFGQARVAYQDYLTIEDDAVAERIFQDEVRPRRNVAYAEWAAGGVLLAGGAALWVTSLLDAPVVIAPTGRGFLLTGRF